MPFGDCARHSPWQVDEGHPFREGLLENEFMQNFTISREDVDFLLRQIAEVLFGKETATRVLIVQRNLGMRSHIAKCVVA